jgi:hypothetical protein
MLEADRRPKSKIRVHANAIYCTMVFVDTLVFGARCEGAGRGRTSLIQVGDQYDRVIDGTP